MCWACLYFCSALGFTGTQRPRGRSFLSFLLQRYGQERPLAAEQQSPSLIIP